MRKSDKQLSPLTVRIDADLVNKLRGQAERERRTVRVVLEKALADYLEKHSQDEGETEEEEETDQPDQPKAATSEPQGLAA